MKPEKAMAAATTFSVHQLGKFPATRSLGREGRDRLEDLLANNSEIDLAVDFSGVHGMTPSFLDEFLGKFLTSSDLAKSDATVKVVGLSEDNEYAVLVCVERRETQVVVLDARALRLVGDRMLAETFAKALQLGTFKASDLGDALGLSAQNANNRLKRLTAVGAVRKTQVTGSSRGGKEFSYETVSSTVADGQPLMPA
jgi:hypothetical protein